MRYLASLLLLLIASMTSCIGLAQPTIAPTKLSERSPVENGHWYAPSQNGMAFEIRTFADQIVVMYYEAGGIWYTANGTFAKNMQLDLRIHHRPTSAPQTSRTVGTLSLNFSNALTAIAVVQNERSQATLQIAPLKLSTQLRANDYSGHWFDPLNPGWGLTLTEYQDLGFVTMHAFSPSGNPVWAFGSRIAPPGTPYTLVHYPALDLSNVVGTLNVTGANLSELHASLALSSTQQIFATSFQVDSKLFSLTSLPHLRRADTELARFDNDAMLAEFLYRSFLFPVPGTGVVFSAAPPTPAYSYVNTIVPGVAEASPLLTDGNLAFGVDLNSNLVRSVDISTNTPNARSSRTLISRPPGALNQANSGLYLDGEDLLVIHGSSPYLPYWSLASNVWSQGKTQIERSKSDPLNNLSESIAIDGHLLGSRKIGRRLLVLARGNLRPTGLSSSTTLIDMLPKIAVNGGTPSPAVTAQNTLLPPSGRESPRPDLLMLISIDLSKPFDAVDAISVQAIASQLSAFYVSSDSIYLATNRFDYLGRQTLSFNFFGLMTTELHKFDIRSGVPRYVATGVVEGVMDRNLDLAPLRFNEHNGNLHVVTTSLGQWGDLGVNRVSVLGTQNDAPGKLVVKSFLPNRIRPSRIGKPGESLYGTRFVGDRLYAVTFRRTDPLYVIDLSNSADPVIKGELEIPGFSEYLHPVNERYLLGFGQNAVLVNGVTRNEGLRLALFDVANPARPQEVSSLIIGQAGTSTPLFRHYGALSYLPDSAGAQFAFPVLSQYAVNGLLPEWFASLQLFRLDLSSTTARITPQLPLNLQGLSTSYAPSIAARSILFDNKQLYFDAGKFLMRHANGVVDGPF